MHRWLGLLLLVAAGCRGSAAPGVTTTVLAPPPPTATAPVESTTTTGSPFAVPAVIDLPYVQRVLETIYHLDGEAARHVYAKKAPDAELNERLEAIFGGPALTEAARVYGENAAEGFVFFARPPGDPKVRVVEIIQAMPRCMILRADLDFGPIYKERPARQPQAVIQLRRADVLPFNPTGWGVVAAGTPEPGTNIRVCP